MKALFLVSLRSNRFKQTQPTLLGYTSCNGFLGLIEPLQSHNEMCLIASAIVTVSKDRETYIRILNPAKSNITLYSD